MRPATLPLARSSREHDEAEDAFSIINRAYGTGGALMQIDGRPDETIHIVDVAVPGERTECLGHSRRHRDGSR